MASYATLRKLTEPTESDVGKTFQRMAELLKESGEAARVQFRILNGEEQLSWAVELEPKVARVRAEAVEHPNLEVITSSQTWWQIADGAMSPVDAIFQGKLRIRGDVELAKRLLNALATSEG